MAEKKTTSKLTAPTGSKEDALANAIAQIEKQFGKGAVMKLGDNAAMQVDSISSGSLGLDLALGVGGMPRGRVIEIYGPESSGKTTLALHVLAEAQKKGGEVAFIDVEHALDPNVCGRAGRQHRQRCWSASRTPASRRWRSARRWCARAPSTRS
jgi:recombination protein RecA